MASTHDFGLIVAVAGEAVGQPGRRQFRLCLLSSTNEFASCWMEKEQLSALGEALEQGLRDQQYEHRPRPMDDVEPPPAFPLNTDLDFRVGRLSIGIDPGDRIIQVTVGDRLDPASADSVEVKASFGFEQAFALATEIRTVVAAGRPLCPLCTAPMDPEGHVCVKQNGHHPH